MELDIEHTRQTTSANVPSTCLNQAYAAASATSETAMDFPSKPQSGRRGAGQSVREKRPGHPDALHLQQLRPSPNEGCFDFVPR
jgi:hypothetical protein